MGALSAVAPTNAGTTVTGAAVAASDTIAAELLGSRGALLEIINAGGSADNITITDYGTTPAGNPLASNALSGLSVPATTGDKVFFIAPTCANPATGLATITHSFTTSVTYKLYRLNF